MNKVKWFLVGWLTAALLFGAIGWLVPGRVSSALEWLSHIPGSVGAGSPADQDEMVEMSLEGVGLDSIGARPVVLLREKGEGRYLPVSIGIAEARAIAMAVQGASPPRPLTHDLLRAAIEALGAEVKSVRIEDLRDGVFYAKVVISLKGKRVELDSRPSDAIALALRTGAPIYAREKLLEAAPTPGGAKAKADM